MFAIHFILKAHNVFMFNIGRRGVNLFGSNFLGSFLPPPPPVHSTQAHHAASTPHVALPPANVFQVKILALLSFVRSVSFFIYQTHNNFILFC